MDEVVILHKTILILAGIVIASTLVLTGCSTNTNASPETTRLAKCLTEEEFTMYGAEWCPHCQEQKQRFGSAFKHVNYVDCERQNSKCEEAGVEGIPMWTDGETRLSGTQPLERLAQVSDCNYSAS